MASKKRLVAIVLAILMLVMETFSLFSCGTKVENFELSFNVDGENYATITTTGTGTIQIPENPSKDGYTFDGWYWDKDVWSKPFTANSLLEAPISSDMSVYARFKPIAYSISYELDGGTHHNPATYTIESRFEFADAQKAGYTFLGWYGDASYTTQIKSISAGTTGDMTLYAKFELATYSIIYENTKGAENTNPTTYTINSETITFTPLFKDGYTFDGWYVGGTKVTEISKGSTGNLTLTARWDTIGYTITYHNVGGATHSNPDSYDVENQPLTLSAASKAGYRFIGWCSDEGLTNIITEIAVGTTGNLDLYAKWEIIEYTATFKDGDTIVGTVQFTVENDSITEPAVPEHTGYTGAWESYALGTEDITVHAVYTLITYNIIYHNVEGAANTNPYNYDVEDQPLVLFDAIRDYYIFKGWYTDAEFNSKVIEIAVGTTGIVNLYAKWEAIEYTATFMDGDTVVGTVRFTVESDSITEPAVPEHTGYTGAWESYALGTEDITVHAVYTPITYTITYNNTKGVNHSNPTSYIIESAKITLIDISATGYAFNGWFDINGVRITEIAAGSIGNVELYAKWTAIKYTITYMYDQDIGDYADENKNPAYYTIEDEFDFIDLVNHNVGYVFNGWFTGKNNGTGTKMAGISLGSTGDITLYAQWGLENYTITYHNVNGATNTNAGSYTIETETFTIGNISKTGYTFDGWFADEALTVPADTTIEKGSDGALDFYAKWTLVGYSINYILYGDTVDEVTNPDGYTIEDSFTLNAPTRDGYIFVGWYTLAENGERVTEIVKNTTGNKTFYARWLKFESNNGSDISYTPTHNGIYISAPPEPTRTHYEFDGWYTNGELTQKYDFVPTESITLYAKWVPVAYEIEYILNGGTNSGDNPATYTVEDKIELCAPHKVGYTFVGWFTDPEFTSTVVTEINPGTSGKITLYAHYLINRYTISFESNGGTTVSDITQNYATDVTAPEAPAKNGYSFAGWYTDVALKHAYTFTTMPAENITLYAKWDIVTYNITYNLDGGTNNKNSPATYQITSVDITLADPAKTGYTFDGWYTDSACTNPVTTIVSGSFGDVELFAKWTAIVYTVTYHMADGATHNNAVCYTIETDLITLTGATLKGHTFHGWFRDKALTNPVTIIAGGEIGNVELYAKFTANTYNVWLDGSEKAEYTVSFALNGAEGSVANQTITPDTTLKYPVAPVRDGYIFAGWYEAADCTGSPYDFTKAVTKDITLYAKWVRLENASLITINGNASVTLNGTTEQMLMFVPLVSGNITITSAGNYDSFGTLYDRAMSALIRNDDGAADGMGFHIVYNVTAGEVYYIGVRAFSSTTSGNITVSISGNTTVLDGGYAMTTSQTRVTYGTSFTCRLPDACDGYKFLGYADENGVMYTDVNGNSIRNWDKDEDTVLYSVWERAVYTVTFVTSGGTEIAPIQLEYGTRFDISRYVTTRDGYTFNGWYLDGVEYNATTMPDHNITLTAYWKTFALGTIKYDTDKKAIRVTDEITPELFGAICLDTNGNLATITVSINGTQAAGETITVRLTATSGGKRAVATITGIKVYGAPTLTFDNTVDFVNVNGGMTAAHFGASGKDTFGADTQIKVYIDGEYEVGTLVRVVMESIDPAGNITYGYIENVKAYGLPEITYNENKTAVSVSDTLNAGLFGATAKDSFGEELTVTVTCYSGTIAAGNTVTIRISATDSKGNVKNVDIPCKVYGMPTVSAPTKTDVRADDVVTPEFLGIAGADSYGAALTVTLTAKNGSQTAGAVWTLTATVTDAAGNVTARDVELMVYGAPAISYDREGVKVTEDATKTIVTVSFDLNGGSGSIPSQTPTDNVGLVYPAIPTRSGYVFAGWYSNSSCTGNAFDFSADVENDITLYAKWIAYTGGGVIEINGSKTISVVSKSSSASTSQYYAFVPLTNGTITIYSANGLSDTYGYLYDSSKSQLATDDDSGDGNNFKITYNVTAGNLYYIRACGYNSSGQTTVYVEGMMPTAGGHGPAVNNVLNASATDSFGKPLAVTATVRSGRLAVGTYIVYTLTATDHLGNTYSIDTAPIGVYDGNDIRLTYSAGMSDLIKYTSKGEEFGARATDSFGQLCDITIEAAGGYIYRGGNTITLYIVATDKAGNRVLSEAIREIKVYDLPEITLGQDNRVIDANTDIEFLFTAHDSFGEELYADVAVAGEQLAGNTVVVTVTATDRAGNARTKQYTFGVLPSEKPFVELYVDGELWQVLFVEDAKDYTLPCPPLKAGFESVGWFDRNGNRYSGTDGTGLLELPEALQLYYGTYKAGYTPIYTVEQLKAISSNNADSKYYLICDLDLNGAEWTPVSTFYGEFEGNGHTVSNFKITGSAKKAGLFGENRGIIKDLGIENFAIDVRFRSDDSWAGGLVGSNGGTITNCYAAGDVSSSSTSSGSSSAGGLVGTNSGTITNCYATGNVSSDSSASSSYAGGLVGENHGGTITNCYATGDVSSDSSASSSYAGGLVGYNYKDSTITNCYALGNTASRTTSGGLVGYNYGIITNCYATSNVRTFVNNKSSTISGGLVGHNYGIITNCYATGNVKADCVGGLVGCNYKGGTIKNCYATGDVIASNTGSLYVGGLVGCNYKGGIIKNCYATGDVSSTGYSSGLYSYIYIGGLVGYNSGTITSCYAMGDVSSLGIDYSYSGGLAGSNNDGTIMDCYRYSGQMLEVKKGTDYATMTKNTLGTAMSLPKLQSVTFQSTTLGWSVDDWSFTEGAHPTLKNTGTTN